MLLIPVLSIKFVDTCCQDQKLMSCDVIRCAAMISMHLSELQDQRSNDTLLVYIQPLNHDTWGQDAFNDRECNLVHN